MAGGADVVIVDAQPLFTRGLELLLPAVSDGRVHVVETTNDAALAAAMVRRRQPDVAVIDLGLGPPGGVRAIAAVHRTEPGVPVVALAPGAFSAEEGVAAIRAGAVSVLQKTVEPEDLVTPLLAVVEGWAVVPQVVLQHLLQNSVRTEPRALDGLSPDERRLWVMISEGSTTLQIAHAMHVSERTAKRLTASLLRHLRVSTRTEAAKLAGRVGLDQDGRARPGRAGSVSAESASGPIEEGAAPMSFGGR